MTPWLASASQWSNGYKTLTFTIRSGAKWSDGTAVQREGRRLHVQRDEERQGDRSERAVDGRRWAAERRDAKGSDQVVFTFNTPSQPYFYYVATMTPIVPQHIWSALPQSKLAASDDASPIGTGPYTMSSCSAQNIKYLRNPSYWQSTPGHPIPQIAEVDYPAFLSNTPANLFLAQGQAQWGGQYIPNVQSFYVSKDPAHRHTFYPPVLNVSLMPNLTNPLLSQLPVRRAIALAIDRATVARLGEGGEQQAANQSGVILPTYQSWYRHLAPEDDLQPRPRPSRSSSRPASRRGSDGIFHDRSGTPLSFSIKTISGYSDWDASLQIIAQELKAVGIRVTVQDENSGPYTTDLQSGKFQLAYAGSGGPAPIAGPSPYYELRGLAVRRQHRLDELRALQVRDNGRAVQPVLSGQPVTADPDHASDPEGDGEPDPVHPDHRGRRLVPVRHEPHRRLADAIRSVRAAVALRSSRTTALVLTHLYPTG